MKKYLWLFLVNLYISTFTFGGGYVVVPMVRKYFVAGKHFFTEDDLMEMAAVAQSTPGAIAINLAALAGHKTAGLSGAFVSCVSSLMPPLVILSVISASYAAFCSNVVIAAVLKGMQAGVAALIVDLIADMFLMILKERSIMLTLMVPAAFASNFFLQVNVAVVLIVCCVLCIIRAGLRRKQK